MMGNPSNPWPYGPKKQDNSYEKGTMAEAYRKMREEIIPPQNDTPETPDRRASKMRLFRLLRLQDASGVSGVGVVAEGVEFSDGTAVLKWTTKLNCTGIYRSVHELIAIHGHEGKTKIVWL